MCLLTGHESQKGNYGYYSTIFLTSALVEGGLSTPRPGRFTLKRERPRTHCLGSSASLGGCGKSHLPTRIRSSNSTKYFVARQLQGNPFLRVHSNTQRFYIFDSYVYVNNAKGTHCCVSMATVVTQTRYCVTLYVLSYLAVFVIL
jgi:hypothetical protein